MSNTTDRDTAPNAVVNKREREYGMWPDPLRDEKREELEAELQRTIDTMREEGTLIKLYEFIFEHRPGNPVRPRQMTRGSYNAVFRVEYTDGDVIMRVPLPGMNAFPDEKVRNEVATLRYIKKMTSIPVPHVYHWGTAAENPLGLGPFIIMDYIPHEKTLDALLTDQTGKGLDPSIPRDKLQRLYRQAANIILQLSRLEMPKIGSLQQQGDSFVIGSRPLTQDMNEIVVQAGVPESILPPQNATYSSSDEWYAALADMHLAHLTFQHNQAIDSADDCRDKFVSRYLFRQLVRQGKLPPRGEEANKKKLHRASEKESFTLWVDDLRPHNMLVDADCNIVGVIDWEWAYFAPRAFSQGPPWWLLLGKPEYWDVSVLDFRERYTAALDVFLEALLAEEDSALTQEQDKEEEWSIDQHIDALRLDPVPLSKRMRQSWDSGTFWTNYAARRFYGFDPIFWEFLDEPCFGKNVEGGYEGRLNLLSKKVKRRMELFVEKKVEESKEEKIVNWDPVEARLLLNEILTDLD
ncbi:kinase-like domain-containing protein [Corynascus novoguineensis]|uniref:Kinase-like domain-containing protein n=1 Tax=Corynascus novoguineensis TaxID=1126955 RepID=A0AAN7D196_9PEZI|nr:kinase-like domain-containing protein [Corynascus novoguineensis]